VDREQIAREGSAKRLDCTCGERKYHESEITKLRDLVTALEISSERLHEARGPLLAQISALVQSLQDCLDFIYSVGADSPSHPHKDAATLICEAGPAMRDSILAAREHDEAIERAALEAAATELEKAFDECTTLSLLHGAARLRALVTPAPEASDG
jgi:hypothetical protein